MKPVSQKSKRRTRARRSALSAANALALERFDKLPNDAFVRVPVVAAIRGVSLSTAWREIRAGRLPPAEKLSRGCTGINVGKLRACACS